MERGQSPMNTAPRQLLSVTDGIFLTVGMIVGALIFKAPATVAGATSGAGEFLFAWLLGGLVSLCGALVYAELAARHPDTGGEYVFLSRGLGRGVGFLFAWSRMTVIQTGAIAAVAFVFGDYASEIFSLGKHSSALWAAAAVLALTVLNLAGTVRTKYLQKVMEIILIAGLVAFALAAIAIGGNPGPAAPASGGSLGFAMIFVLLAYGGWNEAAYLAGEVRDGQRNMSRILVIGVVAVTALYLLVNLAYLAVLGHGGVRDSKAVAADVMRVIAGEKGAVLLALIVCVSVLTTMNAAMFTGARTTYALGRLARRRQHAGERVAAAGRDHARAGGGGRGDPGRLQRHGGLHLARVLDLFPADRPHAFRFSKEAAGRRRVQDAVLSPGAGRVLPDLRVHAVFEHQLRA